MFAPAFVLVGVGAMYHPQADPTRTRCAPGVGFPESALGFGPRDICTNTPGDGLLASPVFNDAAEVEYRHDPGAVLGTRDTVEPNTCFASDNVKYLQTVRTGVMPFAADAVEDTKVTSAIIAADTATARPPCSPFTENMLPHRRNPPAADCAGLPLGAR